MLLDWFPHELRAARSTRRSYRLAPTEQLERRLVLSATTPLFTSIEMDLGPIESVDVQQSSSDLTQVTGNVASGLTIVPTFDASITSNADSANIIATINQAIAIYHARFTDNVTVNIKFQTMGSGLGSSNKWISNRAYSTYRTDLVNRSTSAYDTTALAHLPIQANEPVQNTANMRISTAMFKLLGVSVSTPDGQDGTISLNTSITNNTRTSIDNSKYDLLAVVEHEIDEVLGLSSGIGASATDPQDLFRYDAAGARTYSSSAAAEAYFSVDGTTQIVRFNQTSGGDYGDWYSTGAHTPRVQDAFATAGATPDLSAAELIALDVIGYSLAGPTGISLTGNTVAENQTTGTSVGTLSTTHVDSSATFTYTLVGGAGSTDNGSFAISGNSIVTNSVLDFETKSSYSIRVQTKDQYGLTREDFFTITATNTNDAPTLTPSGTAYLDSITANLPNASNNGTLISTLISRMSPGGGIADQDAGAQKGIAINGASGTSTGTWEYSIDNGANWAAIGTVNNDSARLLASNSNTRLRYVPNTGFNGTAKISFVAWDQSTGTNGGTGVTKLRVGASPFSAAYDLASIAVTNTAPVLNNSGAPTLDSISINVSNVNNPGTLIDTIISRMSPGGIMDSDSGALQGIAINALGGTSTGTWEFSTNNGSLWSPVGTASNANGRLLAADGQTRIRYVPNSGFLGSAVFSFVAWDRTSGTNGGTAAVGTRGGTTAYSTAYEYASISVTNSAPVLTVSGSAYLDPIPMNVSNILNVGTLVSDLISRSGGITDSDPGALQGIAINALGNTSSGTWEYTTNGGTSWSSIGTTGNSNARLLASNANTRIRFVPNLGFTGTVKLAFVAWDQTSGLNGGITSVGTRGGSTAFSSNYDYAYLTIS